MLSPRQSSTRPPVLVGGELLVGEHRRHPGDAELGCVLHRLEPTVHGPSWAKWRGRYRHTRNAAPSASRLPTVTAKWRPSTNAARRPEPQRLTCRAGQVVATWRAPEIDGSARWASGREADGEPGQLRASTATRRCAHHGDTERGTELAGGVVHGRAGAGPPGGHRRHDRRGHRRHGQRHARRSSGRGRRSRTRDGVSTPMVRRIRKPTASSTMPPATVRLAPNRALSRGRQRAPR